MGNNTEIALSNSKDTKLIIDGKQIYNVASLNLFAYPFGSELELSIRLREGANIAIKDGKIWIDPDLESLSPTFRQELFEILNEEFGAHLGVDSTVDEAAKRDKTI